MRLAAVSGWPQGLCGSVAGRPEVLAKPPGPWKPAAAASGSLCRAAASESDVVVTGDVEGGNEVGGCVRLASGLVWICGRPDGPGGLGKAARALGAGGSCFWLSLLRSSVGVVCGGYCGCVGGQQ